MQVGRRICLPIQIYNVERRDGVWLRGAHKLFRNIAKSAHTSIKYFVEAPQDTEMSNNKHFQS